MNQTGDRIHFIDNSVISEVNNIINSLMNISIETDRELNSSGVIDNIFGLEESIAINITEKLHLLNC